MNTWLNKNFGFSKSEFNGILILIILIILLKAIPYGYDFFRSNKDDDKLTVEQIHKLDLMEKERPIYHRSEKSAFLESKNSTLFIFDPNTISVAEWQKLGLSVKQGQAIVNYTTKGGKFYKPEDLKKMYTISPQMYNRLFPFIKIETSRSPTPIAGNANARGKEFEPFAKKEYVVVELNSADTIQLQQIKGIGQAFARRIFAYRTKLGGFVSKQQLMEVYGLDSAKFLEIKDQIKIDLNAVKTINVNTADFEAFKRFPYLSYKQMNAIIQYRKQHGNFNNADDLRKIAILNQQTIDKVIPYLSF